MTTRLHSMMIGVWLHKQHKQVERSPYIDAHKVCIDLEYALDEEGKNL